MVVICLYRSDEICPFSIIRCDEFEESPDGVITIPSKTGDDTVITDYDYCYTYDTETKNEISYIIDLFSKFSQALERKVNA